jgi:hypothetical protein
MFTQAANPGENPVSFTQGKHSELLGKSSETFYVDASMNRNSCVDFLSAYQLTYLNGSASNVLDYFDYFLS